MEKECLAVKLSIEKFDTYLAGQKFTVQTDHRALRWLHQMKESNSRLTRWSLALQPFRFEVIHRAGRQHANADALSRIDTDPCFAQKKERGVWQTEHLGGGQALIGGQDPPTDDYHRQNPPPCYSLNGTCHPSDKPWPPGNYMETNQPTRSPASDPCNATGTQAI